MSDRYRRFRSLLLLLTGSIALAFGQGHWPIGVAVIVGIACIARFFHLTRPLIAVPLFIVAHVLVWEWAYAGMVPLPTPARLGMEAGTSTLLALVFLADRGISRRVTSLPTTLAVPCGWVAFDLASARLSPGGTWGSIAYSFADVIAVAQVASVVGWTGLTFIAAWLGSTINWVSERRRDEPGQARRGLAWMLAIVVAVFVLGAVRIITAPSARPAAQPVRVACVIAPNIFNDESLDALWAYTRGVERPDSSVALARARIAESMEEHFALVERAADDGAELVVWPEANPVLTGAEEVVWIDRARETARSRGIFIGMGMVVFRPGTAERTMNKFVLVDPTGDVVIDFLKATRVPGTQHAKGDGVLPALDTDLGRVSSAICFDLDFPHLIAQAGSSGVDLFLAPSNDWFEARAAHARMARLRAIEQGFALVRPTKDGVTLITDSTGRTRGVLTLADNETGTIAVEVPAVHRRTVYAAIGDAFAWLCCIVFVLLCARAAFAPRHRILDGGAATE